jgi:putative toxin-antitoxin system antitoxin component (TIGR02293 family)
MPQGFASEPERIAQVADLLGGADVLPDPPHSVLDAHELLLHGLPGASLHSLVNRLEILRRPGLLEKAIGMSVRTFQRHKETPSSPLSQEQSGRIWQFAEILAHAIVVFGSLDEAEAWLARPAMGLNQHCPIDLLQTPKGVEIVEQFLGRLEYGVYT